MGIDYILDTSNQHPKIKPEEQLEEFLVVYKLHIGTVTYNVHGLIWAKDSEDAFNKMPDAQYGSDHVLVKEKVIGAVKDEHRREIHDKLHNIGGGIILP
jgi:hypothetical protein